MFTLKLIADRENKRTRFISAHELTVAEESPYLKSISCHPADGSADEIYFVGTVTEVTAFASIDGRVFDHAVIENAEGRTTEVVRVRAIPPASEIRAATHPHNAGGEAPQLGSLVHKGGHNTPSSRVTERPERPAPMREARL